MVKKTIFILSIFLSQVLTIAAMSVTDKQVNEALARLDKELLRRDDYIAVRQARIDSFQQLSDDRHADEGRYAHYIMRIADEYTAFNNDSALYYYTEGVTYAHKIDNDSILTAFRLKRATYLPLAGFVAEAVDEFEGINPDSIPHGLEELYYESGRQMYSYISSFYENYPDVSDVWNDKAVSMQARLLASIDKSSPKYKLNQGEYYFSMGEYSKAKATLEELMTTLAEESNLYARAAHVLSAVAQIRGDENVYLYYLTLSAIADTKAATLEVVSLQELGVKIFALGDIDRAHEYLSIALENAVQCNASMRMIQSSEALPIIEKAHKEEIAQWRQLMYYVIAGMALLLVILVVTLFFLRREMHRMARLQVTLRDANHVKEIYISRFLSLCSIYMDKLNQFCKIANRKISAGQVDELYKMTKSGKFVEEQSREFYEVFDDAFLHLYPTFVNDVNALLRDDEKIVLAEGERLNTDLRILALMRMGIDESARVAQILNYSVHTIYAYRNKLRNRAVNRDTFEIDVMKIGSEA